MQSLYSFEEEMNFDIKKTLRIRTRRQVKKIDLEKIFYNVSVVNNFFIKINKDILLSFFRIGID